MRLGRSLLIARSFRRAWGRHPLRSWAAILGVLIGVALTVLVLTVSSSVAEAVRGAGGSDLVDVDIEVAARLPSGLGETATRRIVAAAGDATAVPVIQINARLQGHGSPVLSILGVPARARRLVPKFHAASLRTVAPARGTGALLLGREWAKEHGIERGEVIELRGPRGATSWTVAALAPGDLPNGGAVAITNLTLARAKFDRPGKTDAVYVQTPPGASQSALEERLRAAAGGAAVVGAPGISAQANEASLLAIRAVLIVVALLGVGAAALVVFVSWRLMLEDERRNISRFLLTGATVGDVALGSALVMGLATLVCALVGSTLGVLAASATRSLSQQLADFTGLAAVPSSKVSLLPILAGFASAFAMTGAAWLFGVTAIRKVPIIDAFRVERPDLADRPWLERLIWIPIAGAVLCMLAVSFAAAGNWALIALPVVVLCACVLAFCIPVGLAALVSRVGAFYPLAIGRYLTANSRRVALLTTTFGVGIAVCVVLSGLITSFDHGLARSVDSWTEAELFVRPGWGGSTTRDTRFPGTLQGRLAALPGVERAGAWTSTTVEESGRQFLLEAWDSRNTKGIVDLIVYDGPKGAGLWRALDRGEVAISQNMARLRGLAVGDRIRLPSADGTRSFRIAAVVDDYLSERGAAIMSLSSYRRLTGDTRVESIQLALGPGASVSAVAAEVRRVLPGYPGLVVADRAEMRHRVTGFFDSVVSVLGGVTIAIFFLVLLVALTTTAAMLNARGKFLGLSSLCGAAPNSVRRQLLAEALLIGAAAWLAGAPAGLLAIGLTLDVLGIFTGLEPEVVIPSLTLILTLPLVLVASGAAVLIPARRLLPELFNTLRFE